MTDARIPLTILTGFLGSGKTSLLKRFLSDAQSGRTAIIVNEYGETQIDGDLITFAGDTTAVRTTTGCLCCTMSGDVKDALIELGEAQKVATIALFEHLIIETTGLADPSSLVHAVLSDPAIQQLYRFNRVITTIDALRGEYALERYDEARQQIHLADTIVVTKTDLIEDPISERELDGFITTLTQTNPAANVVRTDAVTPTHLFKLGDTQHTHQHAHAHDHDHHHDHGHDHGHDHDHGHKHDHHDHSHSHTHSVASFTLRFNDQLSEHHLKHTLTALGEQHGAALLRVKGFVKTTTPTGPKILLVQGVGGLFQFTETDIETGTSQLVFITNALSETDAAAAFTSAHADHVPQ
ncbi:MAG: GTP-binding protein [Pseudomonadota bacterium]